MFTGVHITHFIDVHIYNSDLFVFGILIRLQTTIFSSSRKVQEIKL